MKKMPMLIDGEWVGKESDSWLPVYNPSNGQQIAEIVNGEITHVNKAVSSAQSAFTSEEWRSFKPFERGQLLNEMAAFIRSNAKHLSRLETEDVGKPLFQAEADVEAAARYFEFYAGAADKTFGDTIPIEDGLVDMTVLEPVGVTLHIVPWNYPLQIFSRSVAAAIATGNAVIVKSAEDTPMTTHALTEWLAESNLPKGIFQHLTGLGAEIGANLANHPGINQITFTGSVKTGTSIMKAAAHNIVPVTLELGGKSPNIIYADCDIDKAVDGVVKAIIQNAGQTCSAGSRLLIEASIKDKFINELKERFAEINIGPGINNPDLGPILNKNQYDKIINMIDQAKQQGTILYGGNSVEIDGHEGGYFIEPTIIDELSPDSLIAQEEIFGPILSVFEFNTVNEAINLANNTDYGLVTGIWTKDIDKAHYTASRVYSGQVFINSYGAAGGVQMPFGGYKKSGIGREKSHLALNNYLQVKNIAIKFENYKGRV